MIYGIVLLLQFSIVPGDNTNRDVEIRRVLQGGGQDSTKQLQPQKLQSTVKINPTTGTVL
jgi:hypothetical protein